MNILVENKPTGTDGLISPKQLDKPKAKKLKPKVKVADKGDLIERDKSKLATEDGRELLI